LKAHQLLGLEEIEVKFLSDLTDLERREIEIEENLRRKNFTWAEEVKAKAEVDRIKREMYGSAIQGHGGGWGLKETAASLGDSIGTVSRDIRLAKAIEEFPELLKEKTKEAAWRKYQRLRERKVVKELSKKVRVSAEDCELVKGDAVEMMKKLEAESVDLVLTDPPFAIALDKGFKTADFWAGKIYDDEVQSTLNTIDLVVKECYRVLKENRHLYIFFDIRHYGYLLKMLKDAGFNVDETPCVWYKSGSPGVRANEFSYAKNYELFFLAMKGRRPLNKQGQPNVFEEPKVAPHRKVHPTEKPTPLLRRLIEQSTQPGELVIDPFAGSGSTLVAALECNRKAWGCEIDDDYYGQALLKIRGAK